MSVYDEVDGMTFTKQTKREFTFETSSLKAIYNRKTRTVALIDKSGTHLRADRFDICCLYIAMKFLNRLQGQTQQAERGDIEPRKFKGPNINAA